MMPRTKPLTDKQWREELYQMRCLGIQYCKNKHQVTDEDVVAGKCPKCGEGKPFFYGEDLGMRPRVNIEKYFK